MRELSRRRLLAAGATLGSVGLGGCLTAGPTLRASGLSGSQVFERLVATEPWSIKQIAASIALTPAATMELGVRGLAVIASDGTDFWTGTVEAGQTSVNGYFPADGTATLTATDYDGQFVERLRVDVGGRTIG